MQLKPILSTTLLLLLSVAARADSIVLDSASNGTYTYGLALNPMENVYFPNGTGITFSGVSGVTSVKLSVAASCFTTALTPSSVVFTQTTNQVACSFLNPSSSPTEFSNLFSLQSTSLNLGQISFALNGLPAASGFVGGPVASSVAPEPTSIALLGTGLLCVGASIRRRFC